MIDRMMIRTLKFLSMCFLVIAGGCGTLTYGTGITQEAQLLEDMTNIATFGVISSNNEINYLSRPDLVPPPFRSDLPEPVTSIDDGIGYFPVNPEERRAELLRRIRIAEEAGEDLPEEVVELRRQALESGQLAPPLSTGGGRSTDEDDGYDPKLAKLQREAILEYRRRFAGVQGTAPRRFLTEPPRKYRTPEFTAPIGDVGEKERDPEELKEAASSNSGGGIFDWLRSDDDDDDKSDDSEESADTDASGSSSDSSDG